MTTKYTDIQYIYNTRTSDQILSFFESVRTDILQTLLNNPLEFANKIKSNASLICIDTKCKYNMARYYIPTSVEQIKDKYNGYNQYQCRIYKCAMCQQLDRLVNLKVHGPTKIETGLHKDTSILINKYNATMEEFKLEHLDYRKKTLYGMCNYYLNVGKFMHSSIIHLLIQHFLNSYPHIVPNLNVFICGTYGYSVDIHMGIKITEVHKYVKDTTVLKSLIQQICVFFSIMKPHKLTLGHIGSDNVCLNLKPCEYMYNNIKVSSPVTLQFSDIRGSIKVSVEEDEQKSIYVGHKDCIQRIYEKDMQLPKIIYTHLPFEKDKIARYQFKLKKYTGFYYTDQTHPNLDIYCIFILLFANKYLYGLLLKDPGLYDMWKRMWLPEDFSVITQRLVKRHREQKMDMKFVDILDIIKDTYLCVDVKFLHNVWIQ